MVEANHSIPQAYTPKHIQLTTAARVRMAIMTLAMRAARKEVERHMKSHELRLCDVEHRDIVSWALVYLDDHPELIDQARPVVESWFAHGVFANAQRRLGRAVQHLSLMHKTRRPDPSRLSLCKCHAQNGGME
jgi:hypothetical protein